MPKIAFLLGFYLALRSRSKVGVKVKVQCKGQISGVGLSFAMCSKEQ